MQTVEWVVVQDEEVDQISVSVIDSYANTDEMD